MFCKLSALIAVCCLSFAFGYRRGKRLTKGSKGSYELNGASTWDAALWFLYREITRHNIDILRIQKDIDMLIKLGAKVPQHPSVHTFFKIPGRDYGSVED